MAWNGYFTYDGTEIINSERVEALAGSRPWFRALPELDTDPGTLADLFGTTLGYGDPEDAPWYDPDRPESLEFYGVYPLDISGIEASTRQATSFETSEDGGTPGRIRHGIRSVVFSVALMAETERGASYGNAWLKRALLGAFDSRFLTTRVATGLTMRYLSSKPSLIDPPSTPVEQVDTLSRRLNRVGIINGPTDPVKRVMSCGGQVWITGFTASVGNPFEIGPDKLILTGMPSAVTYGPGVTAGTAVGPTTYTEQNCANTFLEPFFNPLCPPYINPPEPPSVPLDCYVLPMTWQRFRASIPANEVPLWGQVVPTVDIYTAVAQQGVRIRFYEDIDGDLDVTEDPCNYVGDMLISYIPAGATLRLDGVNEIIVISQSGLDQRADTLVYGSDAKPFVWPSMSRGNAWVMVVDFDDTGGAVARPTISLTLTPRGI